MFDGHNALEDDDPSRLELQCVLVVVEAHRQLSSVIVAIEDASTVVALSLIRGGRAEVLHHSDTHG